MEDMMEENSSQPARQRSGCLTAYLIFMLICNPLGCLSVLSSWSQVKHLHPSYPGWLLLLSLCVMIIGTICAVGIWQWKRWAVYVYALDVVIMFIANVSVTGFTFMSTSGLAGLALVGLLVVLQWNQFED